MPTATKRELEIKCVVTDLHGLHLNVANEHGKFSQPVFQKNHYFEPKMNPGNTGLSVRTRQTEGKSPLLIAKFASGENGDPINGTLRTEHEATMPMFKDISQLDEVVLATGLFVPHSKWARIRRTALVSQGNMTLTFDINSGYGPLAELEANSDDVTLADLMFQARLLGLEPIERDLLDRMYQRVLGNNDSYYEDFLLNGINAVFCSRS